MVASIVSLLLGWAALHYYRRTVKLLDQLRWMRLKRQDIEKYLKLEALHREVSLLAKKLFQSHKG
jgi:hypothetical protein